MARKKRVTRQSKVEHTESKLSYANTSYQETEYERFSSKIQTTKQVKPCNAKQRDYIDSIKRNVVSLILGPSGVGKDFIAIGMALQLYNSEESPINKIYYLRSNVGMSHELSLGAIPGELQAKTLQLAYPILDNLVEFMSEGQAKYLIESGKIEVLPIGMLRGRSLKNSFIIASEIQNCTLHHIKTILTRIGEGSKMVLQGDLEQIDFKDTNISGLKQAVNKLRGLSGVGIVEFTKAEVVRHPIIGYILERL